MCIRFDVLSFSANISYRSSIVKYDFEKTVDDEIDEQINDAIFVHLTVDFDVEIERRENFDAMIERETISIQNICFRDVANEVIKSEIFEIVFDEITNDVSIKTDSLDENVANDVDIAIIVLIVSIDATNDCFDVKKDVAKNVNIAITAFDVENVRIAITANIIFDACSTISFREIKKLNSSNLICCCNTVLCFFASESTNFWYSVSHKISSFLIQ